MTEPFIGEVKVVGFNFPPRGWATCQGQLLAIAQNTALFSLLGTQYGGNGTTNFALPDLRGRGVVGLGGGNVVGEQSGTENVTLTLSQYPAHTHAFNVNNTFANAARPAASGVGHYLAETAVPPSPSTTPGPNLYGPANNLITTGTSPGPVLSVVGSGLPHENRQPFLGSEYIIALQGVFPSRN